MEAQERKKVDVIAKYIIESFSEGDWYSLGQLTGAIETIQRHPRLLRSLGFGDEDYSYCVAEVLSIIFEKSPEMIDDVIDQFDIDVWYEQKDPRRYSTLFLGNTI